MRRTGGGFVQEFGSVELIERCQNDVGPAADAELLGYLESDLVDRLVAVGQPPHERRRGVEAMRLVDPLIVNESLVRKSLYDQRFGAGFRSHRSPRPQEEMRDRT